MYLLHVFPNMCSKLMSYIFIVETKNLKPVLVLDYIVVHYYINKETKMYFFF